MANKHALCIRKPFTDDLCCCCLFNKRNNQLKARIKVLHNSFMCLRFSQYIPAFYGTRQLITLSQESPLLSFLSNMNPAHRLIMYIFKISFIVNFPYTSRSSKDSPSFSFLHQNPVNQGSPNVAIPGPKKRIFELLRRPLTQ